MNEKKSTRRNALVLIGLVFLAALACFAYLQKIPAYVFYYYLAMSFSLFLFYAKDKWAAKKSSWRVPENFLHILSLLGGWPGAIVAQEYLRHKSQKLSFRIIFYLTVLGNILALGYVLKNWL